MIIGEGGEEEIELNQSGDIPSGHKGEEEEEQPLLVGDNGGVSNPSSSPVSVMIKENRLEKFNVDRKIIFRLVIGGY